MNESRIIKSIKYHAIGHLLDGEYWHIDKLFAYAAAITYPFISQVEFDDQSGSIKQLVKVLTKFLRTQKFNNLDILSFEGMVSFFVDKLCPNVTYATKKKCLSESITLISSAFLSSNASMASLAILRDVSFILMLPFFTKLHFVHNIHKFLLS